MTEYGAFKGKWNDNDCSRKMAYICEQGLANLLHFYSFLCLKKIQLPRNRIYFYVCFHSTQYKSSSMGLRLLFQRKLICFSSIHLHV